MNIEKAIEILRALADGTDPETGEGLSWDSPYVRPDTIRALYLVLALLDDPCSRQRRSLPARARTPWSYAEDCFLRRSFLSGRSPKEIAKRHLRAEQAIRLRLERLGLVEQRRSMATHHARNEEALSRAEQTFIDDGFYLQHHRASNENTKLCEEHDDIDMYLNGDCGIDTVTDIEMQHENCSERDWGDIGDDMDSSDWENIMGGPDDNDIEAYYEEVYTHDEEEVN